MSDLDAESNARWRAEIEPPQVVVFISGPHRGDSSWSMECNIRAAETLALAVWRAGAAALCPHTNTRFFQNAAPDEVWLRGDLELLRRCDAVLLTPDWERSSGARAEREFAIEHGIPCFAAEVVSDVPDLLPAELLEYIKS